MPDLYADGCQVDVDSAEPTTCEYGAADAATTIAVVGDSKAAQWVPAFQVLAKQNDWRIVTYTKSACQFATVETSLDGEVYQTCRDWTDNVLDRLTGPDKPDVVVTAGQRDQGVVGGSDGDLELSEDAMQAALVDTWTRIEDAGVKVVVLADTPQTGGDIYACVAEHPDDLTACTYDRQHGIDASGAPVQGAAAKEAGVPFVDLTDFICPVRRVPAGDRQRADLPPGLPPDQDVRRDPGAAPRVRAGQGRGALMSLFRTPAPRSCRPGGSRRSARWSARRWWPRSPSPTGCGSGSRGEWKQREVTPERLAVGGADLLLVEVSDGTVPGFGPPDGPERLGAGRRGRARTTYRWSSGRPRGCRPAGAARLASARSGGRSSRTGSRRGRPWCRRRGRCCRPPPRGCTVRPRARGSGARPGRSS